MSQANPYAALAGILGGSGETHGLEIAAGEIVSVSPFAVRVGEMPYAAEEITLCAHVTLPQSPGGKLILVSLDDGQTYYAVGRC